jgi:3-hydroxyacyl-[acyl-carrier-protein] dehydratase
VIDLNQQQFSIKDILNLLPHRYPFLLVDKVISIHRGDEKNIGAEIMAIKNVTINEPFFQGHFPEMPIMPGVLVIEAMAQACGLLAYRPHPSGKKWNFFILGVNEARFRKQVIPGDVLELKCKLLKAKGVFYTFQCTAHSDGELKADAEIFAQMSP